MECLFEDMWTFKELYHQVFVEGTKNRTPNLHRTPEEETIQVGIT